MTTALLEARELLRMPDSPATKARAYALCRAANWGASWFSVVNETELFLFGAIPWAELAKLGEVIESLKGKPLVLWIDCTGGDLFTAMAIAKALMAHGDVEARVIGSGALSAAAIVLLGCARRYATPAARVLIHPTTVYSVGTPARLRSDADAVEAREPEVTEFFANRTGTHADKVREWLAGETYFNAEEAKGAGLIHDLREWSEAPNKPAEPSADTNTALALELIRAVGSLQVTDRRQLVSAMLLAARSLSM